MTMEPLHYLMRKSSHRRRNRCPEKHHTFPYHLGILHFFRQPVYYTQENQGAVSDSAAAVIQHVNTPAVSSRLHLFYLDNVSDEYGYRRLETLDECSTHPQGTLPQKRTVDFLLSSIRLAVLKTSLSVTPPPPSDFFTILYSQDIQSMLQNNEKGENNTQLYEEYVQPDFAVKSEMTENEDEPLYL